MTFYEWMKEQMRREVHPAMKRRFDRDMTTVNEARAVLGKYKATNPAIF